jgi:hypothetical protein
MEDQGLEDSNDLAWQVIIDLRISSDYGFRRHDEDPRLFNDESN